MGKWGDWIFDKVASSFSSPVAPPVAITLGTWACSSYCDTTTILLLYYQWYWYQYSYSPALLLYYFYYFYF